MTPSSPATPTGSPLPEGRVSAPTVPSPLAWQPFTPRGAAAFAATRLNRICLFQGIMAGVCALVVVWFLRIAIFPVVRDAIERLPDSGNLSVGELRLPVTTVPNAAERGWFAIDLDLDQLARSSDGHDFEVRFTRSGAQLCTAFGCGFVPYRPEWRMPFNRSELRPWWDAWQPLLLGVAGFVTVLALVVIWWVLATLYCPVPRMTAFFADRALTLSGSWCIAAASLVPGAGLLCAGIIALGSGWIDPLRFLLVFAIHLILPLIYLVVVPLYLPVRTRSGPAVANPFDGVVSAAPEPAPAMATPAVAPVPSLPTNPAAEPPPRSGNPFSVDPPASVESKRDRVSNNPFASS